MCLQVKDIPEDLNPKIATEDIPCYKILQIIYDITEGCYIRTPCQKVKIEFYGGSCYLKADKMTGHYFATQVSKQPCTSAFDLEWICGKSTNYCKLNNATIEYLDVYEGIHAYLNPRYARIYCFPDMRIFKAIIPKDSYYFIGTGNEIVADKMIIFDESAK